MFDLPAGKTPAGRTPLFCGWLLANSRQRRSVAYYSVVATILFCLLLRCWQYLTILIVMSGPRATAAVVRGDGRRHSCKLGVLRLGASKARNAPARISGGRFETSSVVST